MQYALIADDLTGALDAGAGFVASGLWATLPFSGLPEDAPDADVVLVNTESREVGATEAAARVRQAAEQLRAAGIERVYQKIDSVLRGHPGAELAAVLEVFRGRALVAPAFPAQGRITRDGVQYVHGVPAAPYGGFVRDALGPAAARADLKDAASDEDLRQIAQEAAGNPVYRVWCGTAGLARHVPAALGLVPPPGRPPLTQPQAKRVIVIAGTAHPTTAAQSATLLAAGWAHLRLDVRVPAGPAAARAITTALERLQAVPRLLISTIGGLDDVALATLLHDPAVNPARVIEHLHLVGQALHVTPDTGLVITGGETALQVCQALGARAIHLTGEALPGIPLGLLELPHALVPIATKSGGFGGPDALLQGAATLAGSPPAVL